MELTPELVLRAYAVGIFPMAESRDDPRVHWIDPDRRGVLPIEGFHVPRRLRRKIRQRIYAVTFDRAFPSVVRACAERSERRAETWINPVIEGLYNSLNEMGFAHSVEAWLGGRLVGGLYGVSLGGAFFGESMFTRADDASKVALVHLIAALRKGGYRLLDTQFTNHHLEQFGVQEIPRREYRQRLSEAVPAPALFPRSLAETDLERVLKGE